MKCFALVLVAFVLVACGGATANTPEPTDPASFTAVGLKLVIGVDRTKTLEVKPDGTVVSSETGEAAMKFVGTELKLADESKTLIALEGDTLRTNAKTVATFQGDKLVLGEVWISVKDDGVVKLERNGSAKKMRMHFERGVPGHKRAALMLVAVVFALYAATNPRATIDQFVD